MIVKSITLRLPQELYASAIKLARRRKISLNRLVQESLEVLRQKEQATDPYDSFTRIGNERQQSDVSFAAAAQAEVVLHGRSKFPTAKKPKFLKSEKLFRAECRRRMKWPIEKRIKYGFDLQTKRLPGEPSSRAFKTMAEYRAWCEANLPDHLGFKRRLISLQKATKGKS